MTHPSRPMRSQIITVAIIAAAPLLGLAVWAATNTLRDRQRELRQHATTIASTAATFLGHETPSDDGVALARTIARLELPPGSSVSVRDRDGRILAGQIFGNADRARSTATATVDRLGWTVEVGLPTSQTEMQLLPLQVRNGALLVVLCGFALFAALAFADYVARKLGPLQLAARRIADGDFSDPPRTETSSLELDELQDAFITMARRLREQRDDLDRQVEHERALREEMQSLQRQLVRQERLAAVGLLVSGVAHELNNPLQAILGGIELLEHQPAPDAEAREELGFLKTQTGRARDIIRKLSRFSSPTEGPPAPVDLREVVAEVVRMRSAQIDAANIQLDVELGEARLVESSFTEMQQVLLNFVVNAEQAVQGLAQGRIAIRLHDQRGFTALEVADNGPGVSPDDEAKLFQPFFTTKPVGRGTGLGLSVSYGIIESYGGAIGYRRNEWGGATFYFEMPCITGDPVRTA